MFRLHFLSMKNSKDKNRKPLFSILLLLFLIPVTGYAQIITHNILDLRSNNNQKWQFHPGDSPINNNKKQAADDIVITNTNTNSFHFEWAEIDLDKKQQQGWINNVPVQKSWTYFTDSRNNKIFGDFEAYQKKYKGYGWYRTSFSITDKDIKNKFHSKDLMLCLGRIGQANAVYFNGRYIGGTGLQHDTPRNAVVHDEKLAYDRIRYYRIPWSYINQNKTNTLAVRVYARYNINPGLSFGKYFISSADRMNRSQFWDDTKKMFVMVLATLLALFYLYWQTLFIEQRKMSIYFALTCLAMAANTFMQSQIVYSIWSNALWIKKVEFLNFVLFAHMILNFFVFFTRTRSRKLSMLNKASDILGLISIIVIIILPSLYSVRVFFFSWSVVPALLLFFILFIIIKKKNMPSLSLVTTGFIGMSIMLLSDVLINMQFSWVFWEYPLKDYAFAFFAMMAAVSIVANMKESQIAIAKHEVEKQRLLKYFTPDVVESILSGEITIGGEEKQIVSLFANIVGFTSFSEGLAADTVVERLNDIFTKASQVIGRHKAAVDKYVGDYIMAFWGAPNQDPNDAYNAIACAMEIQNIVNEINARLPEGETPLRMRIGINYGPAICGNIGSQERMEYTVIGDAVNTATRIESNSVPGKIAISESTFIAAGGDASIAYKETHEIKIKGKMEPLKIYIVEELKEKK